MYQWCMPLWTFVRHGESEANRDRWFAGHTDAHLTETGAEQARAARDAVAAVSKARAFSSDLQRARRTAEILLGDPPAVPLHSVPELRERSCGDWEGKPWTELVDLDGLTVLETWSGRPPAGESLRDVAARALAYLASVDDGQDTLVVVHGALIRSVVGVLDGTPPAEIGRWKPANCEVVSRELPTGRMADALKTLPA